jgi:hypothetical protein
MSRGAILISALLVWAAAVPPARATVNNANINDVYCLTGAGKIYRIPNGGFSANLELTIPNMSAEWVDFDPGSGQFIAGPDNSAIRNYQRMPMNLSSVGTEIPNTGMIGGQGGAVDRVGGSPGQPSDLLLADSNPYSPPGQQGVFRVKPDGTATILAAVGTTVIPADANHPAGSYVASVSQQDVIEDVEQNWANGDIYVSVSHVGSLPGAVLRFNKNGVLLDHFDMPGGFNPHCIVFDNRDVMSTYELIVATPESPRRIYAIDIDLPAGSARVVYLRDAPNGASCDDLAISPAGKLIYPGLDSNVYQINLTSPYAASILANVPGIRSVAFVSRNKLAPQDFGLTVGQLTMGIGPTGKTAALVKITDPEFSSGIILVQVIGYNLVVYDKGVPKSLPYSFSIDERREVTQFSFVAEKINNYYGANIQVTAIDTRGNVGDPPAELMVSNKGNPEPLTMDLKDVPPINAGNRVVEIANSGIDKITLEIGGEEYKLNGDAKMAGGQTLNIAGKKNTIKISLNGTTTLLVKQGDSLKVTVAGNGQSVGNEAMITVN